jgi:hypothetical protein
MNRAREAIGAVHKHEMACCGRWLTIAEADACSWNGCCWVYPGPSIAGERAHKATGGKIHEPAANAGNAPTHFPSEPSGQVLEKLDAENSRG